MKEVLLPSHGRRDLSGIFSCSYPLSTALQYYMLQDLVEEKWTKTSWQTKTFWR
jgi:hypothetical protein